MANVTSAIITCLCLLVHRTATFKANCHFGWTFLARVGVCVKVFDSNETWNEARRVCYRYHSDLVIIWDSEMNNDIEALIKHTHARYWIGYNRHNNNNTWKWLDKPMQGGYNNWDMIETLTGRSCGAMNGSNLWTTEDCHTRQHFICGDTLGLCPVHQFPSSESGTCIYFLKKPMTWANARQKCRDEGADLVVITNDKMNEFIGDLAYFNDRSQIYWIGLSDMRERGVYRWLNYRDGSDYRNWDDYKPEIRNTDSCAAFGLSGGDFRKWKNFDCGDGSKKIAICEVYQDCYKRGYGMVCPQPCSNCRDKDCNRRTGVCSSGCIHGYHGDRCNLECPQSTYGLDCLQNCSENCAGFVKVCDSNSGMCTWGCEAGFEGELCDRECPRATYGQDCSHTCSENCAGPMDFCDVRNGTCMWGCEPGYEGERCDRECPQSTFGLDCLQNCSENCAGLVQVCDSYSGTCTWGCEAGYEGEHCDRECPVRSYGQNCSQTCSPYCGGLESECDNVNGSCLQPCEAEYQGIFCDTRAESISQALTYTLEAIVAASTFAAVVSLFCLAPHCFQKKSDHQQRSEMSPVQSELDQMTSEANYLSEVSSMNSGWSDYIDTEMYSKRNSITEQEEQEIGYEDDNVGDPDVSS